MRILLICLSLLLAGCAIKQGPTGPQGETGATGAQGAPGDPGEPCTVEATTDGAILTCGTQSVSVTNGSPGTNGTNADVSLEPFCPGMGGGDGFPETGLEVNGTLIAVYFESNGAHMAVLTDGEYVTTDGRNCYFQVLDGKVVGDAG